MAGQILATFYVTFCDPGPAVAEAVGPPKGHLLPSGLAPSDPVWLRLAPPEATNGTRGTNVSTDSELETSPGLPEACLGTGGLELQQVSETAMFRPTPSPKSSYSNQP